MNERPLHFRLYVALVLARGMWGRNGVGGGAMISEGCGVHIKMSTNTEKRTRLDDLF